MDETEYPFCKCIFIGHCIESNGFSYGESNPNKMITRKTRSTFNYEHVVLMVIDGVRVSLKWQVYHIYLFFMANDKFDAIVLA